MPATSRRRCPRRTTAALAALVPASLLGALVLPAGPASAQTGDVVRISFNGVGSLAPGSRVADVSGHGHDGTVRSADGGRLAPVTGWHGTTSARYPSPCTDNCPKALIEVPSAPDLDLGYAALEWGARLRLDAKQTSHGENVLQKGLYGDAGGQWKLQVDGDPGKPSCRVSGSREDGSTGQVLVYSSVSVADGAWHKVLCRRTSRGVAVVVDGEQRGFRSMRPVRLVGGAPVTIGGKQVDNEDNDQFFGVLDDVYARRL